MLGPDTVYGFGPFELDPAGDLTRDGKRVDLSARNIDILLVLVVNAGHTVSRDAIEKAGWGDQQVYDESIGQALKIIRHALGLQPDGSPYIETRFKRGYRFVAAVVPRRARPAPAANDAALAALAAHRAVIEGRPLIESLHRDAIVLAHPGFEAALRADPGHAGSLIGLAYTCFLRFESTRADSMPDVSALQQAVLYARQASDCAPNLAEAWSALAVMLNRAGDRLNAIVAAKHAVHLEPKESRHHIRLGLVSWGGDRVRAAEHALTWCPGLALAYWLIATVLVARGAFGAALDVLREGCACQDAQRRDGGHLNALGLHWLHALVLAARGDIGLAFEELAREHAALDPEHVYARECDANTWYAIGALHYRCGRRDDATDAFRRALARVPGHPSSAAGLAVITGSPRIDIDTARPFANAVETAIAEAAGRSVEGKHVEGAQLVQADLEKAKPGQDGWLLPAEPLIHTAAHPDAWATTLALLRARAI